MFGVAARGEFLHWEKLWGKKSMGYAWIWVWINTYYNTIFRGMNIHLFTSYFDVNYRGTIGFDTLPYVYPLVLKHGKLEKPRTK